MKIGTRLINKNRCDVNPNSKYLDKIYKCPMEIEKSLFLIKSNKVKLNLGLYQKRLYQTISPILSEPMAKQLRRSFTELRLINKSFESGILVKSMIEIETQEEKIIKKTAKITSSAQSLMNNYNRHGRQKVKLTQLQFKRFWF